MYFKSMKNPLGNLYGEIVKYVRCRYKTCTVPS
jgi:hypothetical protein